MTPFSLTHLESRLRIGTIENKFAIYELVTSYLQSTDMGPADYTSSVCSENRLFDFAPTLGGAKGVRIIAAFRHASQTAAQGITVVASPPRGPGVMFAH